MHANKKSAISFRLDADLEDLLKEWMEMNQGYKLSTLINLALRNYITTEHSLKPVEVISASDQEADESMHKMMRQHKDTLDKLK